MSTLVKKGLKTNYGHPYRIAQSAITSNFNTTGLMTYNEVVTRAERLKRDKKTHPSKKDDNVVFIDKSIQSFNITELRSLLKLDATKSDVKFRLTTNNKTLMQDSINPNLRRLLNNDMYYGIYMNSPSQAEEFLREHGSKYVAKQVQSTVISTKHKDRYTVKEIPTPKQHIKIPIQINDTTYQLSTPSIPIISRLYAIGVPSNHPELASLLSSTYVSPLTESEVPIIEVPNTESKDLIAIVPKHILEHQKYIKVKPASLQDITFPYNSKFLQFDEITTIICSKFGIPEPLFISIPYISESLYDSVTNEKITKVVNDKRVLEESAFDRIEVTEDPIKVHLASSNLPLTPTNIRDIVSPKSQFSRDDVRVTPDILRSVVLENTENKNSLYADRENALELLTSVLGVFKNEYYKFEEVEYKIDLKALLEEHKDLVDDSDYFILQKFFNLQKDDEKIGDFIISLANYFNYNKFYQEIEPLTSERVLFINNLISNILIRLLRDQLKYHFPEYSHFYYHSNVFKFSEIEIKEPDSKATLNKWQNHIRYQIETSLSPDKSSSTHFEQVPNFISAISSIPNFPEPYNYHILINTSDKKIFEISESLNKFTDSLPSIRSNVLYNYINQKDEQELIKKGISIFKNTPIHQASTTSVIPVRLIDPSNLKPWIKQYHAVQPNLAKLESFENLQAFIKHFKYNLRKDIHLNYEWYHSYEVHQLIALVNHFADVQLKELGLERFKELYREVLVEIQNDDGVGDVKALKQSDDVLETTEFDKELNMELSEKA